MPAALEKSTRAGRALMVAVSTGVVALTGCSGGQVDEPSSDAEASAAAEKAHWEEAGKQLAEYYELSDPPEVEVVRYVATEELDEVLTQCLRESGWSVDSGGGVDVPEGQESKYKEAQYVCAQMYPTPARYDQEWGDDQLRQQYAWTTEFVVPCLEEAGHPITNIPSESVFLERWTSERPFFPFEQVQIPGGGSAEQFNKAWNDLEAQCPQMMPGSVMWDGVSIEEWKAQRG
ncbi:hypothetical protein I6I18_02515 [Kytococcus sedentarius]|nr:hypothetical protein [Kytococcus sedentarius]QQB64372.1 hypothetical protein I6I18_02515 [Kytococcus sedentarius]